MHAPSMLAKPLAAATLAFALGLGTASAQAPQKVLRVVPHADVKVLDPNQTSATITIMHGVTIYDMLFAWDQGLGIHPQMVEAYAASPDKLAYSFSLRPGLKFHDGTPVTARDVVASLKRWMVRDVIGQKLKEYTASLEAKDDRAFVLILKEPYGWVEFSLAASGGIPAFIFREKEANVDPFTAFTETIGSGPFTFNKAEWVPGSKVVYDRNPDYVPRAEPADGLAGGKIVKVARVEYKVIPDQATAVAALNAGEVDLVDQPSLDMVPVVERNKDIVVEVVSPLPAYGVLRPNHLYPPFNNVKARQALAMMVNQRDYLQAGFGDEKWWQECRSYFVCGAPYGVSDGAEAYAKPDMAKAKQLLAEAGYKGEKIVIIATNEIPSLGAMAQVTASKLKELGVNVDLQMSDWGGVVTRRSKKDDPYQGGWHIFHTTAGGTSMHHPLTNFATNTACGGGNWFGWPCDEEADRLRNRFLLATEEASKKQAVEALHKRLWEVQPFALTGQYYGPTFWRKNVTGMLKANQVVWWNIDKS